MRVIRGPSPTNPDGRGRVRTADRTGQNEESLGKTRVRTGGRLPGLRVGVGVVSICLLAENAQLHQITLNYSELHSITPSRHDLNPIELIRRVRRGIEIERGCAGRGDHRAERLE